MPEASVEALHDPVAVITAEELVTPVGRQTHLDVLSGHAGDDGGGNARDVSEGLVVDLGPQGQNLTGMLRCDDLLGVLRAEVPGNHPGPARFVVALFVKTDGEGLDGGVGMPGQDGGHQRGVDAAREEDTYRHVGDQPPREGVGHELVELIDKRLFVSGLVPPIIRETPVCMDPGGVITLHAHPMAGLKFAGMAEYRSGGRDIPIMEEFSHAGSVKLEDARKAGMQGLKLRCKGERPLIIVEVEGFDAQTVPEEKQRLLGFVPQGEGEHAVETLHTFRPPAGKGVEDDLGIGGASEREAGFTQLLTQFPKIIDFPVIAERVASIFGTHGLMPGGAEVDDRQAPMTEGQAGLCVVIQSGVVRSSPNQGIPHAQTGLRQVGPCVSVPDSGYSAHGCCGFRRLERGTGRTPSLAAGRFMLSTLGSSSREGSGESRAVC